MQLYTYQARVISEILELFKKHDHVVMAMAPGAGKTFTSLKLLEQLGQRALILAHGTDVLRRQWRARLTEYGLDDAPITIELPQSLHKSSELPDVDLVVVDEAHEFYLAGRGHDKASGMVRDIINRVKPRKTLLLTGTPSKFIRKGYKIVLVSAEEIMKEQPGALSDVYFSVATTCENIKESDYNAEGNVRASFRFEHVETDLDRMLEPMVRRLSGIVGKKHPLYRRLVGSIKVLDWVPAFETLHKTMIACNNIQQARRVYRYFKARGISVVISESKGDVDSENIQRFINNSEIKVLIVVNRGILGFDLPSLVNVVDLTGTRNIDRMYQMYARVMRHHDKHKLKFYFKVSTEVEVEMTKFYMTAALCMLRRDFISKYNGKNLDAQMIPVMRVKKDVQRPDSDKGEQRAKAGGVRYVPVDEAFYGSVRATALLRDIYNKQGTGFNECAFTTLSDIKANNYGKTRPKGYWTLDRCKADAKKYKSRKEWKENSVSAYNAAQRAGWLGDCCEHMIDQRKPNGYWTLDRCKADAKKYKSRWEWNENSESAYSAARKAGWLDDCCEHMIGQRKPRGYWTLDRCKADAKKYKSRGEWVSTSKGAYNAAQRAGWLDDCCEHMRAKVLGKRSR